jgi:predicted nucleotidyltransferase
LTHLYELLRQRVSEWRGEGYPSEDFPAVAEILGWAEVSETGDLRFLRKPQLEALETYWYLRLMEGTPHVFELYERFYGEDRPALLEALGVSEPAFRTANYDMEHLWTAVRADDDFVRSYRLDALRETLALDYPSYIMALAMGAGKTVLIGAIIATEFAMAQEYPDGPFVQNALVFAPGKTIIESLRELNHVPYNRILPPRLYKGFAASVKLTFTRDGEKDIPVVRDSTFNVVVTNTEKIRIRKEQIRKSDIGRLFDPDRVEEARAEVANLRLQAIASLPHLAVFSDEAHHTYGQSLRTGLKRVRQTVDYLAQETNVVCVVNTTGTPYFKRQPLRDVVVWYSLSEGIRDGILKDVSGNIKSYELSDENADQYVRQVIEDFFGEYGDVNLPDGAPARLAMYFPQTDDLAELRPAVDHALVSVGLSPALALVNTSNPALTSQTDIDAFNRLNDPEAPHRLILLVNKGTEGWNCPSLFGCALARRLKTSNNFVLQAASRCLRQVPGNGRKARIYLSQENYGILDRQLSETYGESIRSLNDRVTERWSARLVLRKADHPPLRITQTESFVVRHDDDLEPLHLERSRARTRGLRQRTYTLADHTLGKRVLRQIEDTVEVRTVPNTLGAYAAATELAAQYRLDLWMVYDEVRRLYGEEEVPAADLAELAQQVEEQTRAYEVHDEVVERALAIVKPDGFRHDEAQEAYVAEILYPKDREALLLSMSDVEASNPGGFGFHYDPYNFDSRPERGFFEDLLRHMNLKPHEVEDIYFTGGITDPAKTDFLVQYRDRNGKWRNYTPDFVIRKKPEEGGAPGTGKVLIVEIKAERDREDPINGEKGEKAMAVERWVSLNPDRVKYEMYFASRDEVPHDALKSARDFVGAADGRGPRIPVDRRRLEEFCRKWSITELSFFGSVLTDDFGPDSDVDVLVSFAEDARWGLEIVDIKDELEELFGRRVDLLTKRSVEQSENWIRRRAILETARPYVVAR